MTYKFSKKTEIVDNLKSIKSSIKEGFNYVKNSRLGKIIYNKDIEKFALYNPQVEGEAIRNVKNKVNEVGSYFKKHPIKVTADVIGLTLFGITLGSDIIALHNKPPLVLERIFTQGVKPEGMSILPPVDYYRNPPGGLAQVPLSAADWFSLGYPIAYGIVQGIRGARVAYNWYKSKKS